MKTRVLPGTDLSLSVVGFGCWTIGGEYWGGADDDQSVAAIHAALDAGVTWFDTAPLYGKGHADHVLARALGDRIHDVVIATKVGVRWDGAAPGQPDEHAHSDLRPQWIRADCEASLRRLKEPLDLLQVHWPDEAGAALDDSIAALVDLQDRGLIRHFGLCNYDGPELLDARRLGPVVSLQTPYSLLRREFEGDLRRACANRMPGGVEGGTRPARPVGVLAYEALCRGLLSGKYKAPPQFDEDIDMRAWDERFQGHRFVRANAIAQDLVAIGRKLGVPATAVALGWVADQPGVTAVIAGARTAAQVRDNVQASRLVGHDKVWRVVEQAVARHRAPI